MSSLSRNRLKPSGVPDPALTTLSTSCSYTPSSSSSSSTTSYKLFLLSFSDCFHPLLNTASVPFSAFPSQLSFYNPSIDRAVQSISHPLLLPYSFPKPLPFPQAHPIQRQFPLFSGPPSSGTNLSELSCQSPVNSALQFTQNLNWPNFTSSGAIRMPPAVPLNHDTGFPETHKIERESYSIIPSCGIQRQRAACFEHSNFFKVNALGPRQPDDPVKGIRGAARCRGTRGQAVARLAADRQPAPEIQLRAF
ncbi:hypothetical protein DPX16_9195 [Anabarilius grahami]|uniref:Uncharacterized protein n=1 Tax=Anabarilius grahami TaxID=495550 RepID=A0A3N0Z0J4_ANAGA|nr:hypothetical protein DPX16_9195 [Anabarilius grahami]